MKTLIVMGAIMMALLTGCTDNMRTRTFGGKQTIELEKNQRLVNVTWKGDNLWILTKQDSTKPSIYKFTEDSSFGTFEGVIIIKEK